MAFSAHGRNWSCCGALWIREPHQHLNPRPWFAELGTEHVEHRAEARAFSKREEVLADIERRGLLISGGNCSLSRRCGYVNGECGEARRAPLRIRPCGFDRMTQS